MRKHAPRIFEKKGARRLKYEMEESDITTSLSGASRRKHKNCKKKMSTATIAMKMQNDEKRCPSPVIDHY